MPEYCSQTDITNRLTAAGVLYVADRDLSGTASGSELSAYIDPSIAYAGNLIDGYLSNTYTFRGGVGNAWLKDRAIDIAAAKCIEVGGGQIPPAMMAARDLSIELLKQVMSGAIRVPGLTELTPINAAWASRTPKVLNPRKSWL